VEYYLARGYRSFAYVHMSEVALHCRRGDAFERALMAADQPPPGRINWKRRASTRSGRQDAFDHQARAFFDQLPMPIATLCAGDDLADELLSFCADAAIKVPDELAVMGVDDDDLLCESMDIPLSSVRSAGYQIGRIAVQHLAEGEGTVQAGRIIEVPPPGIAERQSTQAFAVADPALRRALRFMRDHAAESIGIDEVLQVAGLSHTTFAKRFKAAIGRMPAEELRRLRLEHACQLLSETDLSLMDIAQRSGFSSPAYFSATFRREMNQTPTDYRATHATR
jgi:LacI family transcriptional regulator